MNFYKRFMGDYMRDTSHLSLTEHGAYTVLLDHYYSTSRPLPRAADALYRLCRATTKLEQVAVASVVEQFFPVGEDGLRHNFRADAELAKWEEKAEANRLAGRLGGRPKKNPNANPNGFQSGTQTVNEQEPTKNPLQKPESGVKSKKLTTEENEATESLQ
jgi:uncharacterized protein YdaU (DUF1376 family)